MVIGLLGCLTGVYLGKLALKKGDTLTKVYTEKHDKLRQDHLESQKKNS